MTETWQGRVAAVLLALLWLASMGMTDSNAYTQCPTMVGLVAVLFLGLSALLRGARMVRLTVLSWVTLGVGVLFVGRALMSASLVDGWQEAGLLLVAIVFYVAGVFAAQGRRCRLLMGALVVAAGANMLFWWWMQQPEIPMEWSGRPAHAPTGDNTRPVTLFYYKNHAGAFLMVVGMLLVAATLWLRRSGWRAGMLRLLVAMVGVAAVLISADCHTRSVYLLGPVMLVGLAGLSLVQRMAADEDSGVLTLLYGFLLLTGLGVVVYELLFGNEWLTFIEDLDSNSRYDIWKQVCALLPQVPPEGLGAGGVRWQLLPLYGLHHNVLNYAHNEYLQVWVDYGPLGLAAALAVVLGHVVHGMGAMMSAEVTALRRSLTALALLCLSAWLACSMVDYFEHHMSIAAMTAFSLGVLGSPYARRARRSARTVPVRAQGGWGKACLALLMLAGVLLAGRLILCTQEIWREQWRFNELAVADRDDQATERRAMIARLLPRHPSSRLMDCYYSMGTGYGDWAAERRLLQQVLDANPNQLCTAVMLGKGLTDHGCYEEAEVVYRRYLERGPLPWTCSPDWVAFYTFNLLQWGQFEMLRGELPLALSLMEYGLNLQKAKPRMNFRFRRRTSILPGWEAFLKARRLDVRALRAIGTEPDDSWQKPMEPGGRPALYRELVEPLVQVSK
ncbi:MAG: O-antigen ligase family protein [Akkermansia sp.]